MAEALAGYKKRTEAIQIAARRIPVEPLSPSELLSVGTAPARMGFIKRAASANNLFMFFFVAG